MARHYGVAPLGARVRYVEQFTIYPTVIDATGGLWQLVVISPCRDEAEHMRRTLEGVMVQSNSNRVLDLSIFRRRPLIGLPT
jgi:hypothetical protein